MSKCQNIVKSLIYVSELVVAHIDTDLILELFYVLRMIGVLLYDPTLNLGDNKSVFIYTALLLSVIKKKQCSFGIHCVKEYVAAIILQFTYSPLIDNNTDIMTKTLSNYQFQENIQRDIFRQSEHAKSKTLDTQGNEAL